MENSLDFIKNYNALYVEDDRSTRKSLVSILEKFFNKLIVSVDGQDGYEKYNESIKNGDEIHIVISDINMPVKNGLDMVSDIRKLNDTVPCILLTAYNESEYMLEAIKLGVSRYVFKPVNITDLIQHIEDIFVKRYRKQKIEKILNNENELKRYVDIIDHIAIISETDIKGNITYVNDIFCEVSGYTREELIGQPHNIIRHPDMPKEVFENIWNTIRSGNIWRGKIKNQSKKGEAYYVDAHISPMYTADRKTIKGYIAVRFLATEAEMEKRIFKQRVIQSIIQYKSSLCHYESSIQELQNHIHYLQEKISKTENADLFYEQLSFEKKKIQILKQKVVEYAETIQYLKDQLQLYSVVNVKELELTIKNRDNIIYSLKKRLEMYQHKYDILQQNLYNKDVTISELSKMLKFYQQHYNAK
ncbi:MAG: response regulator [Arcobacteraceae bacterium]|jgi:PAS domain S-box-containing protein|nr:response regulator [Arcobacteraceae bacterium]